ncbi:MAG: amidase family protein, partial [Methylococcales bacterium]|nr:amidase family protein [Methylococcales bacterium]
MHTKTLTELAAGLRSREFSSEELTRAFLSRIDRHRHLNAFISVCPDTALEQAKAADQLLAMGGGGPLTGIPVAQKDIFCTQGVKTSCGSAMLDNFIAPYNATVVEKFNAAGAVDRKSTR